MTDISPFSKIASSMFKITRALPSITPEETDRPAIAFAGRFSRLYSPAIILSSDVITLGGVSFHEPLVTDVFPHFLYSVIYISPFHIIAHQLFLSRQDKSLDR